MYVQTTMPVRILVGALVGILTVGAWGTLALGALEGIFGGQVNGTWLMLGLIILISGPVLLGLTNARWPRALLAGLLAPVVALTFSGGWSVLLSILERLLRPFPFDRTATLAAVNIAVLVGTTELLTRRPFQAEIARILRSIGLALSIAFGLELLRNVALHATTSEPILELEWVTWLVITVYAVLIGVNITYFEGTRAPQSNQLSILATTMFISLNFLALIAVLATVLVA
jgi:hypothetical protein